ncbi:YolD-like family protein [Gracilibacillus sp. YIM 98692]|uniref:YolD-like family protein n=1 Tax=Gracilibacillus sp. YIM 98692 TaxID=2663532 RepID=UPI0013D5D8DC|nr:YolD-like family protein [Gracilibacillus sp. YIM 98692]
MKANKLTHGSNLLWESSRMMLPEHKEVINQHLEAKKDVKKPILSEDQLEEMERTMQEAMEFDKKVDVVFHHNKRMHTVEGFILKAVEGRIEVDASDGIDFIKIKNVVDISIQ